VISPKKRKLSHIVSSLKDILTKMSVYPNPLGLVGISAVDIRDIAEATAITLMSDKRDNLNTFEEQMRKHAPSWAAFDIRMGYLERGVVAEDGDAATLTKLLGHEPRTAGAQSWPACNDPGLARLLTDAVEDAFLAVERAMIQ
jgi:hypothetical protein